MLSNYFKKITLHSEIMYVFACLILSLSVAMTAAADFGVSMIVAPAYILSLKVDFLTFGQCEYIIQGILFIIFCIIMKKIKISYFFSFMTCVIYGTMLDMWRFIIPVFNPDITLPGSMSLPVRIILFSLGEIITCYSISIFFKTYIPPEVYDYFVKGITEKYTVNRSIFKTVFDFSFLILAIIMTFIFFGRIKGIGIGTVIMACVNGTLIGFFEKINNKIFDFTPIFKNFSGIFDL